MRQQAHEVAQRGARARRRGGKSEGNARGMDGEGARTFGGRARARRNEEQAHKPDGSKQKEGMPLTQGLRVGVPDGGTNEDDEKKHGASGVSAGGGGRGHRYK